MFGKEPYVFFLKNNELLYDYSVFKSSLSDRPIKTNVQQQGRMSQMARGPDFMGTEFKCCHVPTASGRSGVLLVTVHATRVQTPYL